MTFALLCIHIGAKRVEVSIHTMRYGSTQSVWSRLVKFGSEEVKNIGCSCWCWSEIGSAYFLYTSSSNYFAIFGVKTQKASTPKQGKTILYAALQRFDSLSTTRLPHQKIEPNVRCKLGSSSLSLRDWIKQCWTVLPLQILWISLLAKCVSFLWINLP